MCKLLFDRELEKAFANLLEGSESQLAFIYIYIYIYVELWVTFCPGGQRHVFKMASLAVTEMPSSNL